MSIIKENIVANGYGSLSPSYFCVHSTANPGATAANHASLWSREPTYAVHLVSDWTRALHTVPYNRLCYQVGNGNRYVEGLEICEGTTREQFDAGIKIAAQVVRERLAAHGWGVDRLITHDEARRRWGGTDHTDPLPYFKRWGYSWDEFVRLVEDGGGSAENGEDEVTDADIKNIAHEVWRYMNESVNGNADAYKLLTDVHREVSDIHQDLSRTDNAGHDNPNGHDLYGRVQILEHNISLIMHELGIEDAYRSYVPKSGQPVPKYDEEIKAIIR